MSAPVGPDPLATRAAQAAARFVGDVGSKLLSRAADGVVNSIVWTWKTFWTGSLVAAVVIVVVLVIGTQVVLSNLGLSEAVRADALRDMGAVMILLLALKAVALMIMPSRR